MPPPPNSPDSPTALADQRALVTGACGTVGSELVRQLVDAGCRDVLAIDNREHAVFLAGRQWRGDARVRWQLADTRDAGAMGRLMRGIDVVFHAAAYKHVAVTEHSIGDAVTTNVQCTQNVLDAAAERGVRRLILTSTDKAVSPTSVMGATKLIAERLVTTANASADDGQAFASVRFGNVLGSSGSVIPLFHRQIKDGGPVTVTDPDMTRFVMSVQQAASLVIESATLAVGGEVFVTKMPVVRIGDLANAMITKLAPRYGHDPQAIEVKTIGALTGEKQSEALLDAHELGRVVELERHFVVTPPDDHRRPNARYEYASTVSTNGGRVYDSAGETVLNANELIEMLERHALLG